MRDHMCVLVLLVLRLRGSDGALIRLAEHRWVVLRDYDGAVALYQQAIASRDPSVAAGGWQGWARCSAPVVTTWAPARCRPP